MIDKKLGPIAVESALKELISKGFDIDIKAEKIPILSFVQPANCLFQPSFVQYVDGYSGSAKKDQNRIFPEIVITSTSEMECKLKLIEEIEAMFSGLLDKED